MPLEVRAARSKPGPATGVASRNIVAHHGPDAESEPGLQQALSLIGHIYDAALDPSIWPQVLEELTSHVGGAGSALVSHDVASRKGRFYFSWGDDPHYTKLYFEKYVKLNPILVSAFLLKVGEVRSSSDIIPIEEFRTTRFYKEWAKPAGYGDVTVGVIEKSATVVTKIATSHQDCLSPAGPEVRRRMELLVPHIRRAVAIGNVIEMHKIDAEVLGDAVDALSAGVFLIRNDSRVIRANACGKEMLANGDMLRLDGETLTIPGDAAACHALRKAVVEAAEGSVVVNPRGLAIPLVTRNGDRYVAHILPLTSGNRRKAALSCRAGAAVFVHKAAVDGLLPLEAVAQQFELSTAELRVLVALIDAGCSVPDIAPVLGLSEPTVKTHLRRLFEKTGTKRQADLVKLVAGYSNPLIGSSDAAA
jgi:DNA-binding CsgD family transcriptional regulator